ncbi:SDR family NAD(P)-dependent oxidoreductase [Kribbella sp. NPDC006257]|uniref:SDR family NAD(P)-dependent oxidoreductase n=1 Tax=Kribbella sp. NPDC006257 TaxID=3156738 RepID=UPI0033B5CD94
MRSLVWISGASGGIGAALTASVPFPEARVIDLSRRGGMVEHFPADLSDPADWVRVEQHFEESLAGFTGERVVFVHNAGTVVPIGPADAVDPEAYTRAVLLNSAAPQVLGRAFLRATADLTCEKHLVMLSSGAASTAYAGWSSYNAGKAAVDHWVRTVGTEQPPLNPAPAQDEPEPGAERRPVAADELEPEAGRGAVAADEVGPEAGNGSGRQVGCRVIAVAPGVVDTAMQGEIRAVGEEAFPAVERFRELKESGSLISAEQAARGIWSLFDRDFPNGSVLDLRTLP